MHVDVLKHVRTRGSFISDDFILNVV